MKKLSKLLNKVIKRSLLSTSKEKMLVANYSKDWAIQKQIIPLKTEFDLIKASVIFQGVHNKIAIERAYIKFIDEVENYWSVLDYQERKRIMGFDLNETYRSLPFFEYQDHQTCLIPFFDERMNEIYRQEMVLFDLKQYNTLMYDYKSYLIDPSMYGLAMYNGTFVPTMFVAKDDSNYVLYHPGLYKFFCVFEDGNMSIPVFDSLSTPYELSVSLLVELGSLLLHQQVEQFLENCVDALLLSESTTKMLLKQYQKKHRFGLF